MKIFGAGMAGLIAGCVFQDAEIYEAKKISEYVGHKALLRFRTNEIADLTGIEFKKVKVHKGIWFRDKFVEPTIQRSNMYSKKVIGCLADRSIWNTESVDRWVAPEDFLSHLIGKCESRINWGTRMDDVVIAPDEKIISTIPMSAMCGSIAVPPPVFKRNPISVKRWKIKGANVHQTIYYPDPACTIYRASITGDILTAEYINDVFDKYELDTLTRSFALEECDLEASTINYKYEYGKIAEIDDQWRKAFILHLSQKYNIYSLGRYATWRNILMDDIVQDISIIKKLINSSKYDKTKNGF